MSLSAAGPALFPARYAAGRAQLERTFGVEVVELPHTCADPEVLRRDPRARVEDLHAALTDPDVDGIVTTVGGDDSIRTLRHLDLDLIRAHPKVFLGSSDTTVTHLAYLRAGVVSFYGPAVMGGFAETGGMHRYAVDGLRRMLFDDPTGTAWPENRSGWTGEFLDWGDPANRHRVRTLEPTSGPRWLQGGRATGRLVPVCLEVADWLRGSVWWPDLTGAVLALETSEEGAPPATLERFLRALAATGELARLGALLFGRPGGVPSCTHLDYDGALSSVVRDEEGLDTLPVVTNLDFGHTDPVWPLPVGGCVEVDVPERRVTFTQRPTTADPT